MSEGRLEQVRRALRASAVFGSLDAQQLNALIAYGVTTRHDAGSTIFAKGDPGESMMVVLSGRVRISNSVPGGREAIINYLDPGAMLGEIAFLDGKPRSADAVAATPCELFVLRRRELTPLLEAHPALLLRLIEVLCERLRRATDIMEEVMFLKAGPRVARALLRLADEHGRSCAGAVAVEMKLSQTDLASHVGLSRESVNRELQTLREAGIIALDYGQITIREPRRLRAVAQA